MNIKRPQRVFVDANTWISWGHELSKAEASTLDEAREIARKIIAEYIQTGLPSIAKLAAPKITLAEFLRDHYHPWARSELKGADKYINRLERVFPAALDMPMSNISSAWVERWWMERLQTKARPDQEALITKATAWRDLASFRAVIAKAVKWGMLEQNPIQDRFGSFSDAYWTGRIFMDTQLPLCA